MSESLLTKTARGAGWAIGWRWVTRILGFCNTLILARLLLPGDFGLVAIATGFAQGIQAFSELGIDEAVMRQRSATRATYDTAFTINVIRGLATACVILAASVPVGRFFNDTRLTPVLWALAGCALIAACENIGTIEFRRDFAFGREFRLLLLPRLASIAMTIAAGSVWHSHWALIGGIATNQILSTALGYAMHPYRPRLGLTAWRALASFSIWSWAISIAVMIRDRVDGFVVGRVAGLTQVGVYSVGAELATLPTYELAGPLARACFPGFAEAARTGAEASAAYLRILASVSLIMLPAAAGIALVAGPVTLIALGPGWSGSADVMRVVGLPGAVLVLGIVTATFLSAQGQLRQSFAIMVLSVTIRIVAAVSLVWRYGMIGAAFANALTLVFENLAYLSVAFRRHRLRLIDLLRQVWGGVAAAAAMGAALIGTGLGTDLDAPIRSLASAAAAGALVYGLSLFGLWYLRGRPEGAENDLLALVRRVLPVLRR